MEKLTRISMTEQVVTHLREAIVLGDLPMGAALSEVRIASEMGVSRTPVREALQRLAAEGLVVHNAFRGTCVFTVTRDELDRMVDFREIIEGGAILQAMRLNLAGLRDAVERVIAAMEKAVARRDVRRYLSLDTDLHAAIVAASENSYLVDANMLVATKMAALRTALSLDIQLIERSWNTHQEIRELIATGDPDAAERRLRRHVRDTKSLFVAGPGVVLEDEAVSKAV
ncbi:MAG: GntR family transcriptional regulator [Kiloniellales bacterium]|nr:GntR family transcriptional regulator [Kiloniellales bacterium]